MDTFRAASRRAILPFRNDFRLKIKLFTNFSAVEWINELFLNIKYFGGERANFMSEAGIPKIIHYCWLSGETMPDDALKCIGSWKERMPDYSLVLWDTNRFDIDSHVFVKDACRVKKWAFASDYIRLYALYTEGGIYLDTDVYVKKSFDRFLGDGFFTGVEYHSGAVKKGLRLMNGDGSLKNRNGGNISARGIQIQAAIMGGERGHPFPKACMEWYDGKRFTVEEWASSDRLISPCVYAHVASGYGFRCKNELQRLDCGMTVYPNTVFAGNLTQMGEETCAVHCCRGGWRGFGEMAARWVTCNNFFRKLFGKKIIERIP
jgi:hypothetical protein